MEVRVKITDKEKYQARVEKVDIEGLASGEEYFFEGGIQIYLKSGSIQPHYGLFGADDFKDEFGFVLEVFHSEP